MNDSQEVFTIFYGLYFATSLGLARPLQPFDTAAMSKFDVHAWSRFTVSFVLLNILPLWYFVFMFNRLGRFNAFAYTFGEFLMLLILSLGGFGFYRLYVGVMLFRPRRAYLFYGDKLPAPFFNHLNERVVKADTPIPHLVPGLIWVFLAVLVGVLWTRSTG